MFIQSVAVKGFAGFSSDWVTVKFSAGLNLVYGGSGAGKSSLLELANLLGHVTTLPHDIQPTFRDCTVRLTVSLSPVDHEFLSAVVDPGRSDEEPIRRLRQAIQKARSGELGNVAMKWLSNEAMVQARAAAKNMKETGELVFGFRFVSISNPNELRMALGDDDALHKGITAVFTSSATMTLVCCLLSFSRPERKPLKSGEPAEWFMTPRASVLNALADAMQNAWPEHAASQPVPGYCAYFHTDTFDLGTGLDVRESPKGHYDKWMDMWRGRLQVVDPRGEAAAKPIRFFRDVKQAFDALSGRKDGDEGSPRALSQLEYEGVYDTGAPGVWRVRFGIQKPDVLSSGEEQALFLSVWLKSLYATGSVLLLDEPELHLSYMAHPAIMDVLYESATLHGNQVIAVTHSPFMLLGHPLLTEEELGLNSDAAAKKVALVELQPGKDALYGASARAKVTQRVQGLIKLLIQDTKIPDAQISFGAFVRHKVVVWRAKFAKLFNKKPPAQPD